ncbi:MAG: CDP-alcohol phosphatidyltransferase family protein [Bacteroidota bacterium]
MGFNKRLKNHWDEMMSTIKMLDIEERYDLYFSRFFGLFFAKAGRYVSLTPTQISIISLVIGIIGGGLLYFQDVWKIILVGSFLITVAGVLDSADGQLARMTNQSSELGRIIDGLIDNFVFVSCYLAGSAFFIDVYGYWIFLLAVMAGVAHSLKSAIYDFYKSEYLFYGGPYSSAEIPYPERIKAELDNQMSIVQKLIRLLYLDYTRRQFWLSTRTVELREKFKSFAYTDTTKDKFTEKYRELNFPIMFWWALVCGTNTHRGMIMIFSLFGRFDIYLGIAAITILPMILINRYQKRLDIKLEAMFS